MGVAEANESLAEVKVWRDRVAGQPRGGEHDAGQAERCRRAVR